MDPSLPAMALYSTRTEERDCVDMPPARLLLLLVTACSTTAGLATPPPDAAVPDAPADVSAETSPPDITPDLAPDVAPDLAPDVAPDVAADLTPDVTPDAGGTLPLTNGFALMACETGASGTACGTWTWSQARGVFEAMWTQGARADINLVENGERVVFRRFDPSGISAGLNATYTGKLIGDRKIGGDVTWSSPAGTASGTWTAIW